MPARLSAQPLPKEARVKPNKRRVLIMNTKRIARLFDQRDRAEARLREIDRKLAEERRSYAQSKGYPFIRPEFFRSEIEKVAKTQEAA